MGTLASSTQPTSAADGARNITLPTPAALAIIAATTLLFRLGSLFPEQIDWDEWSFILMGADVASGHLPFVHQFDLKPPLIFFLFGATIALFGKSLLAIRLLGSLCVVAAASLVFLTGKRLAGPWPALAGALVCAVLASAPFGLATSSELPAIAFLGGAVWRLGRAPLSNRDAALGGLFVALAVLTRTNLALVALVVGAVLMAAAVLKRAQVSRTAWLAYAVAGLLPPTLLVLAYAIAGELATLKLAMIDVPLAYSGQLTAMQVARDHAMQLYYTAQAAPLLYGPPVLLTLAGAVFAGLRIVRREGETWPLVLLCATSAAVMGSLLIGGAAYPHYWLQLMPFAGLFAALGAEGLTRTAAPLRFVAAALVALPAAVALVTALPAAREAYGAPRPIAQAAAYIRESGGPAPQVWALHKHLVHWYLDAPQLSRAGVHPDNLARRAIIDTLAAHGYVGPDEVGRLMTLRPEFVVTDAGGKGLAWVRADGKPVDAWLAASYREDAQFGDVLIYRRR
ncbi:4-amino-4-deoxy-L-arabinose transferase-like glycosyltransferase [Novosphingobium chloroacetimidivorans]|uniref:4-amino-4-deoxy-L-arabinose transferase-like glycosyltransferase n=1 Tax=Novosphingobium chloroacetimidivorans TaxID=1428314 RepID=A0A7W7KCI3_9SPHN|nr:glycosyltransferase family 39 protein [Novosphingobium chloroacetimidivorans]MBB4859936.1 4-amino-4-deoxy-L-arabinose transferase-like glycosyltransferase [Novosphingobium chloroacetimidivorans]